MKLSLVVGLIMLAGCDATPVPVVSPTTVVAPHELSAGQPAARFVLADRSISQIRVRILSIVNPSQQALTLTVSVDEVGVGAVAVHPPDSPADYLVALPPEAIDRVKAGNARAEVSLAALPAGEALRADVRLSVVVT